VLAGAHFHEECEFLFVRMMPVEASWAQILSCSLEPGIPRAITMSHPSSSMSFLDATGRSLTPGTVIRFILADTFCWISSTAARPILKRAKVVSTMPIVFMYYAMVYSVSNTLAAASVPAPISLTTLSFLKTSSRCWIVIMRSFGATLPILPILKILPLSLF